MNKILLIVSIAAFSLSSCGQRTSEFFFPDIGIRIQIPDNYQVQDQFPKPTFIDDNGSEITDSTKLKELEADLMKGLLIVSTTDGNNVASFNLALETSTTGDLEQYFIFSKDMQQFMAKQQMKDYDTISSTLRVGNINFRKFLTYSKTKPRMYSGLYLAKVKDNFLVIKTDYIEIKFGENIEKVILNSLVDIN